MQLILLRDDKKVIMRQVRERLINSLSIVITQHHGYTENMAIGEHDAKCKHSFNNHKNPEYKTLTYRTL